MTKILEEIFINLLFFTGIIACVSITSRILIKLWLYVCNYKKDNDEFEKRWYDCE